MDIRIDVVPDRGRWTLTKSGPDLQFFESERTALEASIESARDHHETTGGHAEVYVWRGKTPILVFDTRRP